MKVHRSDEAGAQVLPVERGAGLHQTGMLAAQARLAAGDWVHIFPEGTRSSDGRMGSMRRGVGHLIASCPRPPLGKFLGCVRNVICHKLLKGSVRTAAL